MQDQADRTGFVVDFCNGNVPSSGALGTAPNWQHVAKARCNRVVPITLIVNCEVSNNAGVAFIGGGANYLFQTDLMMRWSDDRGGGEAILDAASGVIVTVGGSWVELFVNHKSIIPVGALPGPNVIVSVTAFEGTVPHPRPVRSQRVDVAAGATTARLQLPRYTYLSRIETVPEVTNQLILRGYQTSNVASPIIQEVSGRNPLVNMSGIDFVDLQNTSPIARTALVIHELCF